MLRLKEIFGRPPFAALNDLDRKLLRHLDFENGFFIEVGAKPRFILVETSEIGKIMELLPSGYSLVEKLSHHDYLLELSKQSMA